MNSPAATIALAVGIICMLMGGIFFFASFVMASTFGDEEESETAGHLGTAAYFGDFILLIFTSVPFFGFLYGARELPRTVQKMKERWNEEPMIRRFLLIGTILIALGAGASFFAIG